MANNIKPDNTRTFRCKKCKTEINSVEEYPECLICECKQMEEV